MKDERRPRDTMLHAYSRALDWLQYAKEFDEDRAEDTLAVIRFQKESLADMRALAGRLLGHIKEDPCLCYMCLEDNPVCGKCLALADAKKAGVE